MAKKIASDIRFLYGGYDPGTSTVRASVTLEVETLDPTAVTDAAERALAGNRKDIVEWAGLFDDAPGDMDAAQAALLTTGTAVLSMLIGTAVGDRAYSGTAYLLAAKAPAKLGDLMRQEVTFKPDQAMGRGLLLGHRTVKPSGTSDVATGTIDDGTLSIAGGVVYVHILGVGGSAIQPLAEHSATGTTWTPVAGVSVNVIGSQKISITGTVQRYVRVELGGAGTGTATSVFVRG